MNKIDDLIKIKKLFDKGLISKIEFQKLKSDIIQGKKLNFDTIENGEVSSIKTISNLNSNKNRVNHFRTKYVIFILLISIFGFSIWFFLSNKTINSNPEKLIDKHQSIIDSSLLNINKDSISLNTSDNSVPQDSTKNNDFDLENFEGEETYEASYVEKRCGDNYYSLDSKDVKSMRFVITDKKMVIKGRLIDLMINSEGIPEMNVSINSLKNKSFEDGKNARLYDVTFYYNVSGGAIGSTQGLLKMWSDGNQITEMRITSERTSQCRFSFVTDKISDSNKNISNNSEKIIQTNISMSTDNINIAIGKYYEGGTVFYIDNTGKHGLLCSKIISGQEGNNFEEAKKLCDNYISVSFKDWYLPSIDELKLLYSQKKSINFLKSNVYELISSSTKYQLWDGGNWALNFNDGGVYGINPKSSYGVIAIRKF